MPSHPANESLADEVERLLAGQLLGEAAATAVLDDPPGLHDCPACARPFVVPEGTREIVGVDHARVDLRCTNCGWHDTQVRADHELAALDGQLDRSYADLLWTLEVVWTANEEAAIERFGRALEAGAILPEDFA